MSGPHGTRGNRQRLRGVVVRDKAAKTIIVEVAHRFRHPRYGKMVRRHTRLAAHDPSGEARVGDTVEIMVCRPLSKTKRYRLLRVLRRGPGEALVGQPPDRAEPQAPRAPEAPAAPPTGDMAEPADQAEAAPQPGAAPDRPGEDDTATPAPETASGTPPAPTGSERTDQNTTDAADSPPAT